MQAITRFVLPLCLTATLSVGNAGITKDIVWVGADPVACDTANLAAAVVTAPQFASVRIANDQSYDNVALQVVSRHLQIEGGYANCQDEAPVGVTQLRGAPGQASYVVSVIGGIDGEGDEYRVTLMNLEVRGGEGDSGGGGGVLLNDALNVQLVNVDILGHHAAQGAGLRIHGAAQGSSSVVLQGVNIGPAINVAMLRNVAGGHGGGLYCENASIWVYEGNIRHNRASGNGGGLWLQHCQLRYMNQGVVNHISNNRTNADGGGLYMVGSQLITADTDMSRGHTELGPSHLVIADNYADTDGGAAYASESQLLLHDVAVTGNQAEFGSGGAFLLASEAQLIMLGRRTDTGDCTISSTDCSLLAGNSGEFDGSIHALQGSMVSVDRTHIIGNDVTDGPAVLRFTGANTIAILMNSLIAENTGPSWLMQVTGGAEALITGTTIANNTPSTLLFRVHDVGSSLRVENSIVWQPGTPFIDGNGELEISCLNAHDNSFHPAAETHDPGFVDADAGDYRLRGGSQNIDRCDHPVAGVPPIRDINGTPRPQFMGGGPGSTWDRGAYEVPPRLFRDRFQMQD